MLSLKCYTGRQGPFHSHRGNAREHYPCYITYYAGEYIHVKSKGPDITGITAPLYFPPGLIATTKNANESGRAVRNPRRDMKNPSPYM